MKAYKFMIVLATIIFIFVVGGITYLELRESYICDIGKNETAGDFKTEPNTFFNSRQCAIEDCSAFNKYQKEIGGEELCVV